MLWRTESTLVGKAAYLSLLTSRCPYTSWEAVPSSSPSSPRSQRRPPFSASLSIQDFSIPPPLPGSQIQQIQKQFAHKSVSTTPPCESCLTTLGPRHTTQVQASQWILVTVCWLSLLTRTSLFVCAHWYACVYIKGIHRCVWCMCAWVHIIAWWSEVRGQDPVASSTALWVNDVFLSLW